MELVGRCLDQHQPRRGECGLQGFDRSMIPTLHLIPVVKPSPPDRLLVDPTRLRKEYLRQYSEFVRGLEKECLSLGISCHRLLTSDPLQKALGAWLAERMESKGPRR